MKFIDVYLALCNIVRVKNYYFSNINEVELFIDDLSLYKSTVSHQVFIFIKKNYFFEALVISLCR